MKFIVFIIAVVFSVDSFSQVVKAEPRVVPALNKVEEVSLQTTYSNDSDSSIVTKTSLYLSDYDKKNNLAVLEATGDRTKPGAQEYIPFIKEKCEGGTCGMAAATGSLADINLAKANEALKKKTSAASIDKAQFKNGSVWVVHSETPDKATGKKWHVTFAVELQKFATSAKHVTLKYKVLEFVNK